jgi:tetrathionate reductase subunit B
MIKEKLAMVIDSSSCIDCKGCMAACKVENRVPDGKWRNWIKTKEADFSSGRTRNGAGAHFQPGNCMHCDKATCVEACPTGATFKDEKDGTVRVNKKLCIGCGSCIPACPYGARYRHPEQKVVDKCDFCEGRRGRGELPACVVTCPTKTRVFGNINDPKSEAALLLKKEKAIRLVHQRTDTKPNIYYLGATHPVDWLREPRIPAPIWAWSKIAKPLVWLVVGINALGVLWMLGKQFLLPEGEDPPVDHGPEDNHKGGHHGE